MGASAVALGVSNTEEFDFKNSLAVAVSMDKVNNATTRESAKALSDLEVVAEQQETLRDRSQQPSQI